MVLVVARSRRSRCLRQTIAWILFTLGHLASGCADSTTSLEDSEVLETGGVDLGADDGSCHNVMDASDGGFGEYCDSDVMNEVQGQSCDRFLRHRCVSRALQCCPNGHCEALFRCECLIDEFLCSRPDVCFGSDDAG